MPTPPAPAAPVRAAQGPSPDEVALVGSARQMGFEFVARAQSAVTLSMLGMDVTYEILNTNEYSSERRAPPGAGGTGSS